MTKATDGTTIRIGWAFDDDEDEDIFILVDATNPRSIGTIEFSLHGNQDYINGFVCQLIGNYPTGFSHGRYEQDPIIDEILNGGHAWHADLSTQEVIAISATRYIIKMENFEDYGIYLTTDDMNNFVEGMRAVPKLLHLHAVGEDELYHIVVEQQDNDWEELSPFIDVRTLQDPEAEIDDYEWSWAPKLDEVTLKFDQSEVEYVIIPNP